MTEKKHQQNTEHSHIRCHTFSSLIYYYFSPLVKYLTIIRLCKRWKGGLVRAYCSSRHSKNVVETFFYSFVSFSDRSSYCRLSVRFPIYFVLFVILNTFSFSVIMSHAESVWKIAREWEREWERDREIASARIIKTKNKIDKSIVAMHKVVSISFTFCT